jgi:hypothetical protein
MTQLKSRITHHRTIGFGYLIVSLIYAILCTQLCGLGHFRMNATMRVLTPVQFNAWLHAREARP